MWKWCTVKYKKKDTENELKILSFVLSYKLHVRKCQLQVAFTKWFHPTELEFYETINNLKTICILHL